MPYKHSTTHLKIKEKDDRRVKLTSQQKDEIRELYATGEISQRELARMYFVSRRLIVFTLYPERREANYKQRVERGGSKMYYDKDKHTKAMREHRRYKQELYLKNELE